MSIYCQNNNIPQVDNSEIDCPNGILSTNCVVEESALAYLSLPAESTQHEVNEALLTSLISARERILILENQTVEGFTNEDLQIDGAYVLSAEDDKKYYYVTSAINNPIIGVVDELPDGFECYFFYQPAPYDPEISSPEELIFATEVATPPLVTAPSQDKNRLEYYGQAYFKKKNTNFYSVTGDLINPST